MKLHIIAHVNSRKPRIEKDLLENIHVHIPEPPLQGKANRAIIKSLAKYLKIKESEILLVSGEKSKQKIFEVTSF